MTTGLTIKTLLKGVLLSLTVILSACVYGPYDTHARVGIHGYYDSAYDDFYFYPDVSVYFGVHSGLYYYRPHDHWISAHTLPRTIILRPERRVIIKKLPRHSPYNNYRDHRDRYYRHDRGGRDSYRQHDSYRYDDGDRSRNLFPSEQFNRDGSRDQVRHGSTGLNQDGRLERVGSSVRDRIQVRTRNHGGTRHRAQDGHRWRDRDREHSRPLRLEGLRGRDSVRIRAQDQDRFHDHDRKRHGGRDGSRRLDKNKARSGSIIILDRLRGHGWSQ